LNAQEGNREQREKNGEMDVENGDFGRGVLKRPRSENAPALGKRVIKNPNRKWLRFWLLVETSGIEQKSTIALTFQ
jgi:hypothetical protein